LLRDGKTVVADCGQSVCFWDWTTGKQLRRLEGLFPKGSCLEKFAVSPDGKMLATRGEYWDLTVDPPRCLQREKLKFRCYDVTFSVDSKIVAWACVTDKGQGSSICLVDAATGKVIKMLKDVNSSHMAFSHDSKMLAIGSGDLGGLGGRGK